MRILIAEDDPTSRLFLERILSGWGYEVVSTIDGLQAWGELRKEDAPKLAVMDWMMPGMDGVEVCRRVRNCKTTSPVYIVLLTALGNKQNVVTGLDAGADDYLVKPFDNQELRARLEVGRRMIALQTELNGKIVELEDALSHVKTLQGILPICMHCHSIRTDEEVWQRLEGYIEEHSSAEFTHGLCPECMKKYYPDDEELEGVAEGI